MNNNNLYIITRPGSPGRSGVKPLSVELLGCLPENPSIFPGWEQNFPQNPSLTLHQQVEIKQLLFQSAVDLNSGYTVESSAGDLEQKQKPNRCEICVQPLNSESLGMDSQASVRSESSLDSADRHTRPRSSGYAGQTELKKSSTHLRRKSEKRSSIGSSGEGYTLCLVSVQVGSAGHQLFQTSWSQQRKKGWTEVSQSLLSAPCYLLLTVSCMLSPLWLCDTQYLSFSPTPSKGSGDLQFIIIFFALI